MYPTLKGWLVCIALLVVAGSESAFAACTTPTGSDGELVYSAGTLRYCNATSWVTVNSANTGATCTTAGEITYRTSEIQYCNGTNWLRTAPVLDYGACVAGDAGKFYWASGDTYYWYCNGANWRRMGP